MLGAASQELGLQREWLSVEPGTGRNPVATRVSPVFCSPVSCLCLAVGEPALGREVGKCSPL